MYSITKLHVHFTLDPSLRYRSNARSTRLMRAQIGINAKIFCLKALRAYGSPVYTLPRSASRSAKSEAVQLANVKMYTKWITEFRTFLNCIRPQFHFDLLIRREFAHHASVFHEYNCLDTARYRENIFIEGLDYVYQSSNVEQDMQAIPDSRCPLRND